MVDHEGVAQREAELEAEVYRLSVVNRLSQRIIGERVGISQQRVSQILARVRESMPPPDLEAMRRHSLELHMQTQRMALELAEMKAAPVTAGKDGAIVQEIDPVTGQVETVRDYSLRLAALETARKADLEIRKLHGLDAAAKMEVSGSVRYEVAGVDVDQLK